MSRFRSEVIAKLTPRPRLELDWKAYWVGFQELHGGNPVLEGGRFLFQDGWSYSATDYQGPEWPPPEDDEELHLLQVKYWQARKNVVDAELTELERQMTGLRHLLAVKNAPLWQRVTYVNAEGKLERTDPVQVDPAAFDERITFLRDDLGRCESMLRELREKAEVADGAHQA